MYNYKLHKCSDLKMQGNMRNEVIFGNKGKMHRGSDIYTDI